MKLQTSILSLFAPKIIAPKQLAITEDIISDITSKIIIFDLNSKKIQLELKVSNGSLISTKNPILVSNTGTTIKLSGSIVDINKYLKTIRYQPPKDSNIAQQLNITAADESNKTSVSIPINIKPINDAPVINTNILYLNNERLDSKQSVLFDIDSNNVIVSISSNNGSVQVHDSFLNTIYKKNNIVQISGNISDINNLFMSKNGYIKLLPINKNDIVLEISVSDGVLTTQNSIVVSQKILLKDHATKSVLDKLKNKDPNISKHIYTTLDHANNSYIRNIQNWAYDLDLTCISPWNSSGSDRFGGTLISPRHIIYATHYQIPINTTIRFITKDNIVIERKVINKISQEYKASYFPDLTIGFLDSDLPSSIGFAKILPENWQKYFDSNIRINVPCLVLDQEEKSLVSSLYSANDFITFDKFIDYPDFFEYIILGDSGNPAFMIIDNQLVILTVWTFGNAGSGTFITSQKNQINKFMKDLGSDYQLTEINLNNFRILS